MDNTSEARRKKIMRRKRVMLKRTHRRINVTFIIVFVLLLVLGVRIFMINYTPVSYTHLTLPTICSV